MASSGGNQPHRLEGAPETETPPADVCDTRVASSETNAPSDGAYSNKPNLALPSKEQAALARVELANSLNQAEPTSIASTSLSKPNVISVIDAASLSAAIATAAQDAHQQPNQATSPTRTLNDSQQQQQQWLAQVAAQTHQEVRQRMSQAGDQLNLSIRQIYASASSIAAEMPPSYHNIPGIVPFNQGRAIGPPPSYDDVINPYAPPPTYHSLFGQMREARKRSRGLVDLLSRLFIILVSTLGCTILVAFMILIPFTMIIVGAAYIDECHIEHIPAFLLVGGLVWASKSVLHCYSQCRQMPPLDGAHSELDLDDTYLSASSSSLSDSSSSDVSMSGSLDGGLGDRSSDHVFDGQHQAVAAAAAMGATTGAPLGTTSGGVLDSAGQLEQRPIAADHHHHHHHHHQRQFDHQDHRSRGHRSRHRTRTNHHNHRRHHRHQSTIDDEESARRLKSSICESLLNCVLLGWFIAGCVIVFRNYEPDFDNTSSPRYCHKTVYMYTFWLVTSAILLLGLFIGCICCLMVSSAVASRQDDVDDLA